MVQKRKTPMRKCIITNEMKPKKELIRVVRNKEGDVFVDPTGKQNGRGAYLTMDIETINEAEVTGALEQQFKVTIDPSLYEKLRTMLKDKTNEK